ncbi:BamA/TamA family outer membrane protein [Paraferrimonas sp. SM1919]|uniref:BamA/TamA family outer membrane protein n=1 Tax=Paraferrimonas sp. SM1919 TaxID=2662263 RepID=UPI0013D63FFF|nr:BamA/TamA family outer membrane protein [Paraferrimonas sp. SM1919]
MKFAVITIHLTLLCFGAHSANLMDQFIDPKDGALDASEFILENASGFLPVPIIITEPAVGFGGGAALLFFHENEQEKKIRLASKDKMVYLPPSVSAVAAAATSNGSWVAGGFHFGSWMKDTWRYQGGLFGGKFNLKYYDDDLFKEAPLNFSIKGTYFMQDLDYRLPNSNWFVGTKYTYFQSETDVELGLGAMLPPELRDQNFEDNDGALMLKATWDSRDNLFTPNSGLKFKVSSDFHDKFFGGDFDYRKDRATLHYYNHSFAQWVIGMRADFEHATSEAPYYARPFIKMRGIKAMRYQDDSTILAEIEARYDITPRWSMIGFAGTGKAYGEKSFSDASFQTAGGAGFRYLVARLLNLRAGMDVAKGPEEWTYYIQVGNAWNN